MGGGNSELVALAAGDTIDVSVTIVLVDIVITVLEVVTGVVADVCELGVNDPPCGPRQGGLFTSIWKGLVLQGDG